MQNDPCDSCGGPVLVPFAAPFDVVEIEAAALRGVPAGERDKLIREAPRRPGVVGACCASGRRAR